MYFDQQTSALHAVHWSKSIFDAKTTFSEKVLALKNCFDQRTACGAPVCWLKYKKSFLCRDIVTEVSLKRTCFLFFNLGEENSTSPYEIQTQQSKFLVNVS